MAGGVRGILRSEDAEPGITGYHAAGLRDAARGELFGFNGLA